MPNFFCGSLVVVRCGPQGLSVLFDRPGDRTAAVAAGYSYLLVSKGSAKTIRMSLSREQPPARVERAQQEQDYAASRSRHAGCRLHLYAWCLPDCNCANLFHENSFHGQNHRERLPVVVHIL